MKKPVKVLLFSGGFDCLIQSHFIQPDLYVYVDMNSTYSEVEKRHLKKLPREIRKKLIVTPLINVGVYEDDSFYIPFRNLMLLTLGFQYGEIVYLGFNEADNAPDKDDKFIQLSEQLFRHLTNNPIYAPTTWTQKHKCEIHAPFKGETKSAMLENYLDCRTISDEKERKTEYRKRVKTAQNIRSCYHESSEKGCGLCNPCVNKAVALLTNGIFKKGLYDLEITENILKIRLKIHKKYRPESLIIQEYTDALEAYKSIR